MLDFMAVVGIVGWPQPSCVKFGGIENTPTKELEMAARTLTSDQAFHHLKSNPFAQWPSRQDKGANRIEPICRPGLKPLFRLAPGEKVFTIGSCFARHIENALDERGFEVVTMAIKDTSRLILNNFSVPSMFNEIQWAVDPDNPFVEEDNFFEIGRGRYIDIHLPHYIRPASLEVVQNQRRTIIDMTRRVIDCGTVIMTLGLVEVWFDTQSGLYLNNAPPKSIAARDPSRFELHVMDYDTTLGYLRKTISLLNTFCREDQKILITVSPVPLLATFTDEDVLIANCYSKSLLRTVAETVVSEHPHINYYPSYESVTLSERHVAWQDDQHHVAVDVIKVNIGRMIEAYTIADEGGVSDAHKSEADVESKIIFAREQHRARNFRGALNMFDSVADRLEREEDRILYAELCVWSSRFEVAWSVLENLPPAAGGWKRQILEGRVLAALGEDEKAIQILKAVVDENPRRILAFRGWVDILRKQGKLEEAISILYRWAQYDRGTEVFRILAEIFKEQGKLESAIQTYETAASRDIIHSNVATSTGMRFYLDFAELLIEQKNIKRAREVLESVAPLNVTQNERFERLKAFTH